MAKACGSARLRRTARAFAAARSALVEETMLKRLPPKNGNNQNGKNQNGNKQNRAPGKRGPRVRELPKITIQTDTREILAHDAHVTETAFWSEVIDRMDSDVYRQMARAFKDRGGSPPGLLNATPGFLHQDVFGRIPHQQRLAESVPGGRTHAQVTLVQRAMDSMGID